MRPPHPNHLIPDPRKHALYLHSGVPFIDDLQYQQERVSSLPPASPSVMSAGDWFHNRSRRFLLLPASLRNILQVRARLCMVLVAWCALLANRGVVAGFTRSSHQPYQQEDQGKPALIYVQYFIAYISSNINKPRPQNEPLLRIGPWGVPLGGMGYGINIWPPDLGDML